MSRRERIRTVVFFGHSRTHWRRVLADTLVGALRLTSERIPARLRAHRHARFLFDREYRILSAYPDWKEAFAVSPLLDIQWCNVNNLFEYRAGLRALKQAPLGIILHSAAWDDLAILRYAVPAFQARRAKLLVCFGNEYNEMPAKIGFARTTGAEYIATQLPLGSAQWLYAGCPAARVLPAPAALNADLYRPSTRPRTIDIGFRGDVYANLYSLGDLERSAVIRLVEERAERSGLRADIAYERYPREEWCAFLQTCRGVVGAESGTYFLERDDHTQRAVIRYVRQRPDARFEEVYERFFKGYPDPVSGKAISSRHFEPIGTRTCQVLLEGHYNGILKADEHYISIRKDFSNADDAIRRFKDDAYREAMVRRTHEYVMAEHTYRHRVESLLRAVTAGGLPA
jgi:hypothetical protein